MNGKKLLAMLLCIAMCVSMFPTWAFAADDSAEAVEPVQVEEVQETPEETATEPEQQEDAASEEDQADEVTLEEPVVISDSQEEPAIKVENTTAEEEDMPSSDTAAAAVTDEPTEEPAAEVEEETPAEAEENIVFELAGPSETFVSSGDTDNAELLDAYAEQQLRALLAQHNGTLMASKNVGERLSGNDYAIYRVLKEYITDVANGTSSSAVFTVALDVFDCEKRTWTPAELGVDSIYAKDSNGQYILDEEGFLTLTEEAKQAVAALFSFDLNAVMDALLADCPFELYWYDKTKGVSYTGYQYSGGVDEQGETIGVVGDYTFSFSVAQEYASGSYVVDSQYGTMITAATDRAAGIVAGYADYADVNKLTVYKNEICGLTDYNDAAAGGGVAYGNPWQLIWVFDGDASTNVVCEGYSKAFQYLCDLSTFNNVTCYTVTGTMAGGTGAGPHMWNLVTMDDGRNYLVDVTNCDSGTVGYPDYLFLAGTADGSVSEGYTFDSNGASIRYTYDADALALYTEAELTVSENNYAESPYHMDQDGNYLFSNFEGLQAIANLSFTEPAKAYYNGTVPFVLDAELVIPQNLTVHFFADSLTVAENAILTISEGAELQAFKLMVNGTVINQGIIFGEFGWENGEVTNTSDLSVTGSIENTGLVRYPNISGLESIENIDNGHVTLDYALASEEDLAAMLEANNQDSDNHHWYDGYAITSFVITQTHDFPVTSELYISGGAQLRIENGGMIRINSDDNYEAYISIYDGGSLLIAGTLENNGGIDVHDSSSMICEGGSYTGTGWLGVYDNGEDPFTAFLPGFSESDFDKGYNDETGYWVLRLVNNDNGFYAYAFESTSTGAVGYFAPGETSELFVTAGCTSGSLHYQWRVNGEDIEGATESSYTFTAGTEPVTYICVVSDDYGHQQEVSFGARVKQPDPEQLVLNETATANVASAGQTVYFTYTPEETKTYKFYAISNEDTYGYLYDADMNAITSDDDSGDGNNFKIEYELTAGQTYFFGARYYNSNATGSFEVLLTDSIFYAYANNTEDTATSIVVVPGESTTLTVNAYSSSGDVHYQWYDNEGNTIDGATEASYTTDAITGRTDYRCHVSDDSGNSADVRFYLRVDTGFYAYAEENPVYADLGASAALAVSAGAEHGTVSYQWYQSEKKYYNGEGTEWYWDNTAVEGATEATLTTAPITKASRYYCHVTGEYGDYIDIYFDVYINSGLYAYAAGTTSDYQNVAVPAGESVTLAVTAGADGGVSYQWKGPNGAILTDETEASYQLPVDCELGYYTCSVRDTYGQSREVQFYVRIDSGLYAYAFDTDQAYSQVYCAPGDSITLSVTAGCADGSEVTYRWVESRTWEEIDGAASASLTLQGAAETVSYTCIVKDSYGNEVGVSFDVSPLWAEADGDADSVVSYGQTATLKVKVTAPTDAVLTYAWDMYSSWSDGDETGYAAIDNNADTLTTEPITKNVRYVCTVTDQYGNAVGVTFTVDYERPEGYCGDNITWEVNNGTLTLTGTGEMWDYYAENGFLPPWDDQKDTITKVVVSDGVTSIGNYAFATMPNLTEVSLPDSVTSLHSDAFSNSVSLTEIELPTSLTEIRRYAFYGSGLTAVTLPEGTATLGEAAFMGCGNMTAVTIPVSLTDVGYLCFTGCDALTTVQYPGTLEQWQEISIAEGNEPLLNAYDTPAPVFYAYAFDTDIRAAEVHITKGDIAELYVTAGVEGGLVYYQWYQRNDYEADIVDMDSWSPIEGATGTAYTTAAVDEYTEYLCVVTDDYNDYAPIYFDIYVSEAHIHNSGDPVRENVVAATCTEAGSYDEVVYCTVCNEELSRETKVIPALGHDYTAAVTDPTCEEQGYTTYTCSRCGDSYVADHTAALGHDWDDGVVSTEPTCTEDGVKTFTCQRDSSHVRTEVIPATGHTPSEPVFENEVAATCTEAGSYDEVVYCAVCNEELSRETKVIPALDHTPGEPVRENEVFPTKEQEGGYDLVVYCTVCDEELSRNHITTPAIPADYEFYARANDSDNEWAEVLVPYGQSTTLRVNAYTSDGGELHYQWYVQEEKWNEEGTESWLESVEMEGETGPTLTVENVTKHKSYECVVTDAYNQNAWVWFDVTVDNNFHVYANDSDGNYADVKLNSGETTTLRVRASADTGEFRYQWFRQDKHWNEEDANWYWDRTVLPGETGTEYTTEAITTGAEYGCEVTDCYGNVITAWFNISVENNLKAYAAGTRYTEQYINAEAGETVTLTVEATANDPVGITYQWYWLTEKYGDWNEISGETAASYTIQNVTETSYYVCQVQDAYGNYAEVRFTVGIGLIQLAAPTNVHWITEAGTSYYARPGVIYADVNQPCQNIFGIAIYRVNADGSEDQIFHTSMHYNTTEEIKSIHEEFFISECDPETGDYRAEIWAIGDGTEFYDSDRASTEIWHYERPAAKLNPVTDITLKGRTATWPTPSDTTYLGGYSMEIYYSATENGPKQKVGGTWGYHYSQTGTDSWQIYDECFEQSGAGYYTVRVKALSSDITLCQNSDWSEYSNVYNITTLASEMDDAVQDINTQAEAGTLTDEQIREAAQALDTEELHIAMAADNDNTGVVKSLEELEQKLGGSEIVVTDAMSGSFNESDVNVVGAALNTPEQASDTIRLVIDKPQFEDVIPPLYDSSLAVKFSMTLENVENVEELAVPVKVTLPIPAHINPDFLRILHYHVAGGEPEYISPYTFSENGVYYATFVLTSFSDFAFVSMVDRSQLYAAITYAEGLTEEEYTAESWAAMQTALTAARTVMQNTNATQSEVDAAQVALDNAVAALKPKGDEPFQFTDVRDSSKYYYKPVYWAADKGITKGYSDGSFGVGKDCTRREILTFLWRFAGQPTGYGDARTMFNDMGKYAPSSAANKAVAWAYKEGIVKGYADGGIHPDASIIRKDVMIMLYRLAGKPAVSGTLKFTDCQSLKKNSDTYKAILWGSQNGITNGYSSGEYKGQFGNNLNCLREQIVTFLYRYNSKISASR